MSMALPNSGAAGVAAPSAYSAYGLRIVSELELPELAPCRAEGGADLAVRVGEVAHPWRDGAGGEAVAGGADEAWIRVPGVCALRIAGGRTITVDPEPGAAASVLRLFLLGGALGIALHQRGVLTLHASAVAVAGGAALFLGRSGEGKSTLAAALHARGHSLIADDVAAVVAGQGGAPTVLPGYPQLKLWPDAARALGDARRLEPLHPELEKGRLPAGDGFARRPLPVRAVYLLEEARRVRLRALPLGAAFAAISAHGYAAALLGGAAMTAGHLRLLAALAEAAPAFALGRPRRLADLPAVAARVAGHCAQLGEGAYGG